MSSIGPTSHSAAFLNAVLENLSEGVVACDAQGTLTNFNRATREFHGLAQKSIPPEEWAQHYSLYKADGVTLMSTEDIPLFRALNGEVVKDVEMIIAADVRRTVLCNGQLIFNDQGEKLGAVVTMHDITEVKKATEEINNLNKNLEDRVISRTLELQKINTYLAHEIYERHKAEGALAESEKRFRTLFEQSPLSVQLLSVDGRTLQVNSAWRKLWAIPEEIVENVILKNYNLLEDPQLAEKGILPQIKRGLEGHGGKIPAILYDAETKMLGRGRWVEGHIEPIFDEDGNVSEAVLIHIDVTDKIEFETQLKAARDAAEEANRVKSAFLANMSHEIRTPLGAILGFSELLKDQKLPPQEAVEYLEIIDRSGKALIKIIDDILDLSKVETGRLHIENISTDIGLILSDVVSMLKIQATQKQIELIIHKYEVSLTNVYTDPIRLRQILINLIGNAVKFTQAGKIEIRVIEVMRNQIPHLQISVADAGVGISEEKQNYLFKPFSQIDDTRARPFGGTGLGLALSKRLAEAMHAEVFLEKSELKKGSTFCLALPLENSAFVNSLFEKDWSVKQSENDSVPELSGLKILLVDDSDDNLRLINRILTKKGALVFEASNGAEALAKAASNEYDIVLMDIQMPVMDGFEAIQALRQKNYQVPIIALTAHAMIEERDRCLRAGANAHLPKPVQSADLSATIRKLTKINSGRT